MNYAAIAKDAAKQIQAAGLPMTLRVTTPGTFDPATGMETGGSTADHACYGIIGAPQLKGFGNTWLDGTVIQAGDLQVTIAADGLTVEPRAGHVLVVGSDAYTVVTSMPVRPGGVALLHKVVGRLA